MESRHRLPRLCFRLTAATALLGVILRTVCMLTCFDADIGYFDKGILPLLSNVLYFVAVLIPLVCMILTPKGVLPTELHTPGRMIPALLLTAALGGFTVANLVAPAIFSGIPEQFAFDPVNMVTTASNLLAFPAALYFLASARRDGCYPDWLSFLGYVPVLWGIAAAGDTYFDRYVAMNSPVKLAVQLGLLGLMLICLGELRYRVDSAQPRYSAVFLSVGSYACLVGAVPLLVAACAGIIHHPRYVLYAAVQLCAGLYGLYLLFHCTAPCAPQPENIPEATPDETTHNAE
jgi:hypothetical protein